MEPQSPDPSPGSSRKAVKRSHSEVDQDQDGVEGESAGAYPTEAATTTLVAKAGLGQQEHFEGGSAMSTFPSLQKLELHQHPDTHGTQFLKDIRQWGHAGVTQLDLISIQFSKFHVKFGKFRTQFPAVTHLKLSKCKFVLEVWTQLFTTWPSLQVFHIENIECDKTVVDLDKLLTGVPQSKQEFAMNQIKAMGSGCTLEKLRALQQGVKTKPRPSLDDLKQLREFTFIHTKPPNSNSDPSDNRGSCIMTDIGGYLGLALASPTLRHIQIKISCLESPFLTIECEELIRTSRGPSAYVELQGELF